MQREYIEGNKLIAVFMGFKKRGYLWMHPFEYMNVYPNVVFEGDNTDSFRFHSSWNWLMPVVFKILFKTGFTQEGEQYIFAIQNALGNCEITNLWKTVVEFIEWHNKQSEDKLAQ